MNIVGKRLKDSLDLGLLGSYGRQAHYFETPSGLEGDHIQKRLTRQQVLTKPGQQRHALNIIRSWDPQITSVVILFPIVLSLIVSIVWSVVASTTFKADVQTSTQTGFTIGSYVVTAGISPRHRFRPLHE
jgi:sensor domain CHASE-containing protein